MIFLAPLRRRDSPATVEPGPAAQASAARQDAVPPSGARVMADRRHARARTLAASSAAARLRPGGRY